MSYPTPEVVVASFNQNAETVMALAPSLAMLLGLLLVLVTVATPGIWITCTVVRATGWRGAAFMGLLWSSAWSIVSN